MSFGSVLSFLIDEFNMTQKELAIACSVSPATISTYVMNTREPDLEMLKKIADFFHVSIDYLLEYENQELKSEEDMVSKIVRDMSPGQRRLWLQQGKQFLDFDIREKDFSEDPVQP